MKVLWVNNIAIPQIAKAAGLTYLPVGGWMVKLADELSHMDNIELTIAFPCDHFQKGKVENLSYYGFSINEKKYIKKNKTNIYDKELENIINDVKPDVIHIFGTEYIHTYAFTEICKKMGIIDKVIISIQGLVSICSRHYSAFLPYRDTVGMTLRDLFKGNVKKCAYRFQRTGQYEVEAIKNVKHVIGRTDWDKACTLQINPNLNYHFNNEMLRESFYVSKKWDIDNCDRYSIFLSQAGMPLKGLHIVLEAIKILKKDFPNVKLYVAGKSYYDKKAYKLSYYEKTILKYINKNNLRDNVIFTGYLDETKMVDRYLKSNVFVSASSIENSPNSLCEAMMLGVPVISSMVGGVANLMEFGKEGFFYQADAPYMLAYYAKQLFENENLCNYFSKNEILKAEERHSQTQIKNDLIEIYNQLV